MQLTVASDLAFKIGGYSAGFDLDFVSVTGNFTRNGTLHVALANGFVPGPSDTFYLVQSGAASGAFANVPSGSRLKTTDNLGSFVVTYDSFSLQLSNYQSTDLNGDGIEDAWATRFFGVSPLPNGTGPNDKFGDKDGDGLSNYAEFITGTNPTNAASAFKLTPAGADATSIALRFPSVFGRTYHFWFSTNLADWVELPVPGFTHPQPDFAQWTDDGSVLGSVPFTTRAPRYYRLAVE